MAAGETIGGLSNELENVRAFAHEDLLEEEIKDCRNNDGCRHWYGVVAAELGENEKGETDNGDGNWIAEMGNEYDDIGQ